MLSHALSLSLSLTHQVQTKVHSMLSASCNARLQIDAIRHVSPVVGMSQRMGIHQASMTNKLAKLQERHELHMQLHNASVHVCGLCRLCSLISCATQAVNPHEFATSARVYESMRYLEASRKSRRRTVMCT